MADITLNPFDSPQSWDTVTIGGQVSPGVCKLSGFKRGFGWEIKKGKGAKGSTVTLNEYPPAEGTLTFQFWLPQHVDDWNAFQDVFQYDPTKKPISAIDIYHPALAALEIDSVVCKDITSFEMVSVGLYQATVTLIEYNPPPNKNAVSTPNGAKTTSDGKTPGSPPDPVADAQQAEIAKLLNEAKQP